MIDLKKKQKASLTRQRYKYSFAAKFFFLMMDIITGKKVTLAKAGFNKALYYINSHYLKPCGFGRCFTPCRI